MKKILFIATLMILSLGATTVFAGKSDVKSTEPVATENKLSADEIARLTKRVEEIRNMDKSDLTHKEKRELKNEMKEIKTNVEKSGGYVYIGGASLLLIILLLIILI
jgi:hypothetical protein